MDPTLLEATLDLLAQAWMQHILLALGIFFLSIEVHLPGSAVPALAGSLFTGLAVLAGWARGLVSPVELGILAIGLCLVAIEVFAIPGTLFTGASGVLLLLAAVYLSMLSPRPSQEEMGAAALTLLFCLLLGVGGPVAIGRRASRPAGPMVLAQSLPAGAAVTSPRHLVGATGTALTDCRPAGRADFGGHSVPVVARGGYVPRGATVEGRAVQGGELVVEAVATPS